MIHCSGKQSLIKLAIFPKQITTDNYNDIALVQKDVFQPKSPFHLR